jgi:hypothetical protein
MDEPVVMGYSPGCSGDPKWAPKGRDRATFDLGYRLCLRGADLEWPSRCQRGGTPLMGTHPSLRGSASGPLRTSLRGTGLCSLQGHQPSGITLAAQLQLGTYHGWPIGQHYTRNPTTDIKVGD